MLLKNVDEVAFDINFKKEKWWDNYTFSGDIHWWPKISFSELTWKFVIDMIRENIKSWSDLTDEMKIFFWVNVWMMLQIMMIDIKDQVNEWNMNKEQLESIAEVLLNSSDYLKWLINSTDFIKKNLRDIQWSLPETNSDQKPKNKNPKKSSKKKVEDYFAE